MDIFKSPEYETIVTADESPAAVEVGGWLPVVVGMHQQRHGRLPALGVEQVRGEVEAKVNASQWVVECPFCGDYIFAHETIPFMCVVCGNADNGLRPMRVKFPVGRRLIESILLRRPMAATRNWIPGERIYDLVMENREHGIS